MSKVLRVTPRHQESGFFGPDFVFNGHVFEFAGFKDVAAFLAFYKFSVVVAGYYPDARVPAGFLHNCAIWGDRLAMVGIWIEFIIRTMMVHEFPVF